MRPLHSSSVFPVNSSVYQKGGVGDIKGKLVKLSPSFLVMCVFLSLRVPFQSSPDNTCPSFQQTDFSTCSAVKEIHALLPLIKGYSSVSCLYQSLTGISILLHVGELVMLLHNNNKHRCQMCVYCVVETAIMFWYLVYFL